jgi:hypothetical protein
MSTPTIVEHFTKDEKVQFRLLVMAGYSCQEAIEEIIHENDVPVDTGPADYHSMIGRTTSY